MKNKEIIEAIIIEQGFSDYQWINPKDIVVAQWVRVKCMYGCKDYGLGTCPPNSPSVDECRTFFNEYNNGFVIKLKKFADKNAYPNDWSAEMTNKLLELERHIFLNGNQKAFLLNQSCCELCKDCTKNKVECKDKKRSRPSPESFAVDVFQTLKNAGLEIQVITKNPSEINRIALLLID